MRTISTLQTAPHTKLPICVKKAVLLFFLGGHDLSSLFMFVFASRDCDEYATHERIQIRTRNTRTNPNSNKLHTNESKFEHATHERIQTRTRYTRTNPNPNTLHTNESQLEHATHERIQTRIRYTRTNPNSNTLQMTFRREFCRLNLLLV